MLDAHYVIGLGGFMALFLLILTAVTSTILYFFGLGPFGWMKYVVVVLITIFATLAVLSEVLMN